MFYAKDLTWNGCFITKFGNVDNIILFILKTNAFILVPN